MSHFSTKVKERPYEFIHLIFSESVQTVRNFMKMV